ncbi:MAG: hypothetical protein WDW36_005835 [Sanguina aurantia]
MPPGRSPPHITHRSSPPIKIATAARAESNSSTAATIMDLSELVAGLHSGAQDPANGEEEEETDEDGAPMDPLSPSMLSHLMSRASPRFRERFSMDTITRSLDLAKAARREMDGRQHSMLIDTERSGASSSSEFVVGVHDLEVLRQQAAADEVDKGVVEESGINKQTSDLVLLHLDRSRRCLQNLAKLLQALSAAESAYVAAMWSAAKMCIVCEGDDEQMRSAAASLCRLPSVISQAHRPLHANLTSLSLDVVKLLDSYRGASRELAAEAGEVARNINRGRRSLTQAVTEHGSVCRSFDLILGERARGRPSRAPELDPWATEARLVQEHKALQQWQDLERGFLRASFSRVSELEALRTTLTKQVMSATGVGYRAALLPLQHDLLELADTLQTGQPAGCLSELKRMASTAGDHAQALAQKQALDVAGVCEDLFCSPEIERQGDMKQWNASTSVWSQCHFVLTRAGYLHWFSSMGHLQPLDMLHLARCQFEQGEASHFSITEVRSGGWLVGSKSRKLTFQASGVEECCEWAIAIREAIAVACGKQLAFDVS